VSLIPNSTLARRRSRRSELSEASQWQAARARGSSRVVKSNAGRNRARERQSHAIKILVDSVDAFTARVDTHCARPTAAT
jgi:predicted transcriptional regulator